LVVAAGLLPAQVVRWFRRRLTTHGGLLVQQRPLTSFIRDQRRCEARRLFGRARAGDDGQQLFIGHVLDVLARGVLVLGADAAQARVHVRRAVAGAVGGGVQIPGCDLAHMSASITSSGVMPPAAARSAISRVFRVADPGFRPAPGLHPPRLPDMISTSQLLAAVDLP
jgi:hypothetical protein